MARIREAAMTMFTSSPGSSLMVAMIYCIVISRIKLDGL